MRRSTSTSASSVPRVDPVRELASLFPPRAPRAIDEPIEWDSLDYAAPGSSLLAPWDVGASESLSSLADVDEYTTRQHRVERVGVGDGDWDWGSARAGGAQRRWDESFVLQCDAEPFCVMPYVDLELDLVPPRAVPREERSAGARRDDLKKGSDEDGVGVQPSETEPTNS